MFDQARDPMFASISIFNEGLNPDDTEYQSDFSAASNKYALTQK